MLFKKNHFHIGPLHGAGLGRGTNIDAWKDLTHNIDSTAKLKTLTHFPYTPFIMIPSVWQLTIINNVTHTKIDLSLNITPFKQPHCFHFLWVCKLMPLTHIILCSANQLPMETFLKTCCQRDNYIYVIG